MIKDKNFDELTKLMDRIKMFTPKYLSELGVASGDPQHMITCLSPDHEDSNPSCGYYKEAKVYHCFGCGSTFDIFKIATLFEDKPDSGKEFLIENVFYLAAKFNIPFEHLNIEFTEEDLIKLRKFKIMKILEQHVIHNINEEYLNVRKISLKTAKELSIGSADWKSLIKTLEKEGIQKEEYSELGILEQTINSNKLILIVRDNEGRPVTYVSREMKYTKKNIKEKLEVLKLKAQEQGMTFDTKKAETAFFISQLNPEEAKCLITPKYINGKRSIIYNKSKVFYGYSNVIDKITRTSNVYIVEGYLDFVTAYEHGHYNVLALGSASFTDEHLDVLENSKIKKVAIALDQDKTGKDRTKTLMERIKGNESVINKYFVADYLEKGKDLDEILLAGIYKEVDEFGKVTEKPIVNLSNVFGSVSIFEYSIKNLLLENMEDEAIVELILPTIMQEDSPVKRTAMCKELAKYTISYTSDTIIREINYRSDIEKRGVINKLNNTFEKYKNEVIQDPKNAEIVVGHMVDEIVEIQSEVYVSKKNIFDKTTDLFTEYENNVGDVSKQIKTGFDVFDQARLTSPAVITICGRANSFKTTLFENIGVSILQNNPNAMVFFYTTDDTYNKVVSDIISNISGLPRDYVHDPYNHYAYGVDVNYDDVSIKMFTEYEKAKITMETWMKEKRLVIQHSNQLQTFNAYEAALKEIGEDKDLKDIFKVSIIDSLNRMSCGIEEPRQKLEFLSDNIKKAAERNDFLVFQNVELKKVGDFHKVSLQDLKGTSRFEYDSNMIVVGNNNFHNLKGKTNLQVMDKGTINPIISLEVEKTKMGGEKFKPFFYPLFGGVNKMTELKHGTEHYQKALVFFKDDLNNYMNTNMNGNM